MIAVIRVRGIMNCTAGVEATLRRLHLYKKNHAALLQDEPVNRKTLAKIKDHSTWGIADEETLKMLEKTYGKSYFRLNSPRKGFGRKGIKKSFSVGGALGDRKEKINDLIRRML